VAQFADQFVVGRIGKVAGPAEVIHQADDAALGHHGQAAIGAQQVGGVAHQAETGPAEFGIAGSVHQRQNGDTNPGVVADRLAGLHHRAGQRGFGDEHAGPYRVLQLVLVHRAIGVAQQVHQQIEHARLHGDRPPLTPHLPARRVHGAVAEPPGRAGRAFHAGQGDT